MTETRKGEMIILGPDKEGQVRIEPGFKRVTAIATEELLDDAKTAPHYYVGEREDPDMLDPKTGDPVIKTGVDCWLEPIEIGKKMTYLDYYGERVFYVYQRRDTTPEERRERETTYTYIFEPKGTRTTEEAAIEFGKKLRGE